MTFAGSAVMFIGVTALDHIFAFWARELPGFASRSTLRSNGQGTPVLSEPTLNYVILTTSTTLRTHLPSAK